MDGGQHPVWGLWPWDLSLSTTGGPNVASVRGQRGGVGNLPWTAVPRLPLHDVQSEYYTMCVPLR